MKAEDILETLEQLGTAQAVKIYQRHGAGENVYGVSFADLNKLRKEIRVDHDLAEALWKSGNVDAMSLAAMIADPDRFTVSSANAWLKDVSYSLLGELLGGVIARSKLGLGRYKQWSQSKQENTRLTGYVVFASMLRNDAAQVPDDVCRECLEAIEDKIHASPNLARHTMNGTLIAIGVFKPSLRKEAVAAARRIGRVVVDHGQTSCHTPDAVLFIRKAAKRRTKQRRA